MLSEISDSIRQKELIRFRYHGSTRVVEPHTVGTDLKGHLMLCGWQTSGGSGTGWRNFHLQEISDLAGTGETFEVPRPNYNPRDSRFSSIAACL